MYQKIAKFYKAQFFKKLHYIRKLNSVIIFVKNFENLLRISKVMEVLKLKTVKFCECGTRPRR